MLALCPEHPKRDQNPKFTPLSETTSIPVCFIWESPPGKPVGFVFRESWCFPRLGKHQDSRENKTNCFPRDLTLNVYYSPPDPPSERRQTRVSYKQNGFPVCCRNKQRNFTNNQTNCPRNTNKVTKFGLEVLTGKDFLFDLNLSMKPVNIFFCLQMQVKSCVTLLHKLTFS